MNSKNKFVTDSALHHDGTKWITNKHVEIPLPSDDSSSGYGRSITPAAFRKMVSSKLVELKNQFIKTNPNGTEADLRSFLQNQTCSVEFGKESILRVLSQKDVVGLRFTFCLNDQLDESIIVSGLVESNEEETILVDGKQETRKKTLIFNKDAYRLENINDQQNLTSFDDEKGVGKTYLDFFEETKISLEELIKDKDEEQVIFKFTNTIFGIK
ncbi:MAG: hypothetical protein ACK5RG_02725 [Cyclobacteriaceae bacterium]|jgi:hypothetical protein|nr:hypothetical protein [Flammeovirgaceae bacterium]